MDKQQQEFEALAQEVNGREFGGHKSQGVSREVICGLVVIVAALIVSVIVLINS